MMKDKLFPVQRHGLTNSHRREYNSWLGARYRTTSTKHPLWDDYGGRGIAMCERWRFSFAAFLADMGPRPEGTELDRIDNDGDYEPSNCRWVPHSTNVTNAKRRKPKAKKPHRHTYQLSWGGVSADVYVWSHLLGIESAELHRRHKRGWKDEWVLGYSLPAGWIADGPGKLIKVRDFSREVGLTLDTIHKRLAEGITTDELRANFVPIRRRRDKRGIETMLSVCGVTLDIVEWSRRLSIRRSFIRYRLEHGATHAQAVGIAPYTRGEVAAFNRKLAELNRQLKREGGQGFTILR